MLTRKLTEKTIGKTFADKLDENIIDISEEFSFSRREMVEIIGCANFHAASSLQKILKRLRIFTIRQLYQTDPFSLARAKGIGETALYVAMCILDSHHYNVEKWWGWKGTNVVKFSTFKHHAMIRARKHKQVA